MINNDKASHFIINQFVHKWQKIVTTSQLLKVDNDAKKKQIVFYKTCWEFVVFSFFLKNDLNH